MGVVQLLLFRLFTKTAAKDLEKFGNNKFEQDQKSEGLFFLFNTAARQRSLTAIINTLVFTIDKKKPHKIVLVLERCPAAPDTAKFKFAARPWPVPLSGHFLSIPGPRAHFLFRLHLSVHGSAAACRKTVEYSVLVQSY